MAGVFDVLSQAGALPLEELQIRSSDSDVNAKVAELEKLGLVVVKQEKLPEVNGMVDFVELTKKGFKTVYK